MAIALSLKQYLDQRGAQYQVIPHVRTSTSLASAHAAHVPAEFVVKSVILEDEDGYVMAVLPASHRLRLGMLHRVLKRNLGLATEPELAGLFQDCDLGAIPPFGTPYGLEVIVDDSLADRPDVYFEAGDHCDLIHMSARQFERLLPQAHHARFSERIA